MPKSHLKAFKKHKRVFDGRHVHNSSESIVSNPIVSSEENISSPGLDCRPGSTEPSSLCELTETRASTSSMKLSYNADAYKAYEEENLNDYYDLINLQNLQILVMLKTAVGSKRSFNEAFTEVVLFLKNRLRYLYDFVLNV